MALRHSKTLSVAELIDNNSKRLSPGSLFVEIHNIVSVVFVLATCIIVALQASFIADDITLWVIVYFFDAAFIFDMALQFNTAYEFEGFLVSGFREIASNYLKSTLILDIISILPTDLIVFAVSGGNLRILAVCRLNRVIRIVRMFKWFSIAESNLRDSSKIMIVKSLCMAIIVTHWVTCIWYALACPGGGSDTKCLDKAWPHLDSTIGGQGNSEDGSVWTFTSKVADKYVASLYWAVATTTSTGYGDIRSNNEQEKWYSVLCMLTGVILYGYILGSLASMLANSDSQRVRFEGKLSMLDKYMKTESISRSLLKRVISFYEYLWVRNRGADTHNLLHEMPIALQAEVSSQINQGVIEQVPLFEGADDGFLRLLSLHIKPYLYLPGENIVTKGDIGREMFFVRRGEVLVMNEDNVTVDAHMFAGSFFGELSLIFAIQRVATVKVAKHSDLFVLKKEDLDHVLEFFPHMSQHIQNLITQRFDFAESSLALSTMKPGNNDNDILRERASQMFSSRCSKSFKRVGSIVLSDNQMAGVIGLKDRAKSGSMLYLNTISSLSPVDDDVSTSTENSNNLFAICEEKTFSDRDGSDAPAYSQDPVPLRRKNTVWIDSKNVIVDDVQKMSLRSFLTSSIPYNAPFRIIWGHALVLLSISSCITVSYQAAFGPHFPVLWAINYTLDFIFIVDVMLNFRFGYRSRQGHDVRDPTKVQKYYLNHGGFSGDLSAILPTDLLVMIFPSEFSWEMLAFLRVNRLIRWHKVVTFFTVHDGKLDSSAARIRALKFLVYIIVITHWTACIWYVLSACSDNEGCRSGRWAVEIKPLRSTSVSHKYIVSLYWAVATMTSTGYGDVSAASVGERIFALGVMLLGLSLYGYVLGTIAATLANADSKRVLFQEKIRAIEQFMMDQHLRADLQERVTNYFEYLWKRYEGQDLTSMFNEIPIPMQVDIAGQIQATLISTVPLFRELEIGFIRMLSLDIKPQLFLPGEYLLHQGDIGREMYFVKRGSLDVLNEDDGVVIATLGPGSFVGETSLLFSVPRTASIRAATHTDVFMLKKDSLEAILATFPQIQRQFSDMVSRHEHISEVRSVISSIGKKIIERGEPPKIRISHFVGKSVKKRSVVEPCSVELIAHLKPTSHFFYNFIMPYTFLPQSVRVLSWQQVICVAALIGALTTPIMAAFFEESIPSMIINYFLDALFLVDFYLNFHFAYHNDVGILVTHPYATARNYLRTNFTIDIIGLFPLEVFTFLFSSHRWRVFGLLRLNRLFRMYKPKQYFNYLESRTMAKTERIRSSGFLLLIVLSTNWVACIWYLVACSTGCSPESWIHASAAQANLYPSGSRGHAYISSMYWATATMTSVGYGDIVANTDHEMVFALLVAVLGIIMYGYIIGGIAASLTNADSQRARFQEQMDAVHGYMRDQHLSKNIKDRVIRYYEYLWRRNRGVNQRNLFKDLPVTFQAEVSLQINQHIIEKVPLFQGTDIGFMRMLSLVISPLLFLRGEYVVHKGDIGNEMYFIHRGQVDVVSPDGGTIFASMRAGSFFGEISLIFSCPRTASIRAANNCDLFVLTKTDLDNVLRYYPAITEQINTIAENRYNVAKKRNANPKDETIGAADEAAGMKSDATVSKSEVKGSGVNVKAASNSQANRKLSSLHRDKLESDQVVSSSKIEINVTSNVNVCDLEEPESIAFAVPSLPVEINDDIETESAFEANILEVEQLQRLESQRIADEKAIEAEAEAKAAEEAAAIAEAEAEAAEKAEKDAQIKKEEAEAAEKKKEKEKESDIQKSDTSLEDVERNSCWHRGPFKLFLALHEFVILPESPRIVRLEFVQFILAVATSTSVAYQAAFLFDDYYLFGFNYICEFFVLCVMYCKCHCAYVDDTEQTITGVKEMTLHYFKTEFLFDAVSGFPLEFIALAFSSSWSRMQYLAYLRLPRLLRSKYIVKFFAHRESQLNSPQVLLMVIKFTIIVGLSTHWITCIWNTLSCTGKICRPNTWAKTSVDLENSSNSGRYGNSLYWSVATMTSTGYGDITAASDSEKAFAVFSMIFGKLLFGFILGSIASTLVNADIQRVRFSEKLENIQEHLVDQGSALSEGLQRRVIRYYHYMWTRNKGVDGKSLFNDLPLTLQSEVALNVNQESMERLPLFQGADAGFMRMLSLVIQPVLILPHEYIVRKGDIGKEMFFIHRGTVEVVSEDSPPLIYNSMHSGSFFGEVSLLTTIPHTNSLRAATHVDLFVLSKEDLDNVLQYYPDIRKALRVIAKERFHIDMEELDSEE